MERPDENMGCGASSPAVKAEEKSEGDKNQQHEADHPAIKKVNIPQITTDTLDDDISSGYGTAQTDTANRDIMLATHGRGCASGGGNIDDMNASPVHKANRNIVNGYNHNTNNDGNDSEPLKTDSPSAMGEDTVEDKFDISSDPLSRADMTRMKNQATQETLKFVYKTSTRIAPPTSPDCLLTAPNWPTPTGGRMTHRRGSGVPPPPRELKSTDFLARRAAGVTISMAEEEEEGE